MYWEGEYFIIHKDPQLPWHVAGDGLVYVDCSVYEDNISRVVGHFSILWEDWPTSNRVQPHFSFDMNKYN
eukprot:UN03383